MVGPGGALRGDAQRGRSELGAVRHRYPDGHDQRGQRRRERRPAALPGLLQVHFRLAAHRVVQLLHGVDPGDPVGALHAVPGRQQVPPAARLDEADRVDGAPPCRLVPRGVPQPQPLAREDRAADRGQVQVGVRVAEPPAPVDQHPVRRIDGRAASGIAATILRTAAANAGPSPSASGVARDCAVSNASASSWVSPVRSVVKPGSRANPPSRPRSA
jgi:hypothetical protein